MSCMIASGVDRIEDCITFITGKAAQTVFRQCREVLAPYGITPVQYAVLQLLWEKDRQTGAEIGSRLVLDSATITGVLDRLEKLELVERRSDRDDRRVNRICLTSKGRKRRTALQSEMDSLNRRIEDYLGSDSKKAWKILQQLADFRLG
jgi:MarR family transcriptional regulator, organic hydroperoxide resistance regulator